MSGQLRPYVAEIYHEFSKIKSIIQEQPIDVILITSPHFQGGAFQIGISNYYLYEFSQFNRSDIKDKREGHLKISNLIQTIGEEAGFLAPNDYQKISIVDYGTVVPLKFLDPGSNIPIIPISISMGNFLDHINWGIKLRSIIDENNINALFITSTELSQTFSNNPKDKPTTHKEDLKFINLLINHEIDELVNFNKSYFHTTENELKTTYLLAGYSKEDQGLLSRYTGVIGVGCAFVHFKSNLE